MDKLTIYLPNGTFSSSIHISSDDSKIKAYRVFRDEFPEIKSTINHHGVYLLLVGQNSVYVGYSNKVGERIVNTHTNHIESTWHTVIAFIYDGRGITENELKFLENALCEYIHHSPYNCITTSPQERNCNASYRINETGLVHSRIQACNKYLNDIKYYLEFLKDTMFIGADNSNSNLQDNNSIENPILFYCKGRGAKATGHRGVNNSFWVDKDSIVSNEETANFIARNSGYHKLRLALMESGIISNNKFVREYQFESPSAASAVVLGRSSSGKFDWKTSEGTLLKDI